MAAKRSQRPAQRAQLQTGTLLADPATSRHLSDLATAVSRLEAKPDASNLDASVTALQSVFTSSSNGLAPASGGGSDNFLRSDGAWKSPPGRHLAHRVLPSGAGLTYTPTPGTIRVLLRMISCGGGGGGGQGAGASLAVGAGGSSGYYLEVWIDPGAPITGGLYTALATGGAGGVGAANGTAGADASIVIQGVTYTAHGGPGGSGMTSGATTGYAFPGAIATGSAGDVGAAFAGQPGIRMSNAFAWSGSGADAPFGGGGSSLGSVSTGVAGGVGAGGGGAVASAADKTGGAGGGALILIDEFN